MLEAAVQEAEDAAQRSIEDYESVKLWITRLNKKSGSPRALI